LSRALRWLSDGDLYRRVARRDLPRRTSARPASITAADEEVMRAIQRYEAIERADVSGWANVFSVVELAKHRRRHILEPLLNDVLLAADFDPVLLPTFRTIRQGLGRHAVQFDAAAFYDQFPLSPEVSAFFSLSTSTGTWRFARLPMGFRPACSIAQEAMQVLAAVNVPGVTAFVYIDNVLFTGDNEEDVIRAGEIFKARCASANVTLNDPEINDPPHVFDFLGVNYNLEDRTARNTEKTISKLQAAQDIITGGSPFSLRQVAAIFGILFYAQSVVPLPLHQFFAAMQYFRKLPLWASESPARWNQRAPTLPPTARQHLHSWLAAALARPSVPLVPQPRPGPELRIWTDASAYGWGALIERLHDGALQRIGRPWSAEDRAQYCVTSSVIAEPLALRRAVLAACTLETKAIEVRSDHLPLVWAWRKGSGRIAAYNDCLAHVARAFPNLHVDVQFVKGVDNIHADAISRGLG